MIEKTDKNIRSIIFDILRETPGIRDNPMRSICIDKVSNLIDQKIEQRSKVIRLEMENTILGLREEIRKDISCALKSEFSKIRNKNLWIFEIVKFITMLISVVVSIKYAVNLELDF